VHRGAEVWTVGCDAEEEEDAMLNAIARNQAPVAAEESSVGAQGYVMEAVATMREQVGGFWTMHVTPCPIYHALNVPACGTLMGDG
jgi:hypothetical protein